MRLYLFVLVPTGTLCWCVPRSVVSAEENVSTLHYMRGILLTHWRTKSRSGLVGKCRLVTLSACRIGLKAAQGEVWLRVKVQRLGAPLVTHLAPSKEAKEAGGNACHWVQQGARGLTDGCCVTDLQSHRLILHVVLFSISTACIYTLHLFFAKTELCSEQVCVCRKLYGAIHFALQLCSGDRTGMWATGGGGVRRTGR